MDDSQSNVNEVAGTQSPEGMCKLTKKYGHFARSHIIPRSLTRLTKTGERMVEVGIDKGIKKRYDSWFDTSLVTQEGEKILEEIDTPAIEILRRHKMLWSSWNGATKLASDDLIGKAEDINLRTVIFENSKILQLFFLSLVWRAAASTRPEMHEVNLTEEILEDIRLRILNKDIGNSHDYPIHLHQITTIGVKHNRTPLLETVNILLENGKEGDEQVDRVRLYFDGLVAHVHIAKNTPLNDSYVKISLGNGLNDSSIIIGRPFSDSRANENIKTVARTVSSNLS
ncbi:hypothetical protein [Undibacterium terreum]|uniref:Uncharacterized protein n=1 Tax=Undibacterium terreum TaxID=1224302 RepID=A0A916U9Z7_9BURK|nr:hypothetical protein [Undibacterium terreum]GGC66044.1 hypothetical protein GCM10011396_11280 [Undibacterium terreum]